MTLRDEDRRVIAQGIVLESTIRQNSVRVRVTAGQFFASSNYTLKSSVIEDTTNSEIISVSSLSSELRINNVSFVQNGILRKKKPTSLTEIRERFFCLD